MTFLPSCCGTPVDQWPWTQQPTGLTMVSLSFESAGLRPDDFRRCDITPPLSITGAVEKRQAEYLAGRLCARQCLLATTGNSVTPARGDDGAPIWPDGCVGSITHTQGWAAAVAGPKPHFAGLGLDAETLLSDRRATALARKILTPAEQKRFQVELDEHAGWLVTLVFSMKESLFKALYPLTGQRFYFQDAELVSQTEDGTGRLRLLTELSAQWPAGREIDAQFVVENDHAISLVAVPADQQR
ncbi:4'-phosphopantetheinyl transferase family protein [Marinobacter halotolerans]|uniref:4'-phosphopantetheinyl transferase family protein n=1 Tax=Marinobacter halotolerans TaxID=1569211 RepID=UPI0012474B5E|nr:4'-phosphopantetheinyl transferase superfamily protein [Marinobacter halotolerans]